jgi:NitT/TauT family transport system ATP-binding protein
MPAAIECRRVCKTYHSTERKSLEVLDNVDLTVEEGEFHVLIGPSGCGKSTLLWMIGGLTQSTSGEIQIEGKAVTRPVPDRVAMVFQQASLFPWRTLLDNVCFGPEMSGQPVDERHRAAREYIDLVGLSGFERHYPHELSGGMQQRAAIAQALAQNPGILLMDEPFGALDEMTRMAMGDELLRIWEATRKTVVFVTHSLQEATYLADRVTVLSFRPGRIMETIRVDLPRPRRPEMMTWPEFDRLRNHLWILLHREQLGRAENNGSGRQEPADA